MKAVILAGGKGTRLSEETVLKPKPMVEVGGMPILWHILKIYSAYGIHDFVILCGYRGYLVKEYFANYFLHCSDVTIDMSHNRMEVHRKTAEPWKVTLVDTGQETMTGGRLKRVKDYIGKETFCFTYGDGVSDVNVSKLVAFHRSHGKLATVTAMRHPSRFGILGISEKSQVSQFAEKPIEEAGWMNSGFFVLEPPALDFIDGDQTVFEKEPLHRLVAKGELMAYRHEGFFQGMDSLRDRTHLEELWNAGKAPWKVW
jgi:glucose-1-phosphate cytidylyltransferase